MRITNNDDLLEVNLGDTTAWNQPVTSERLPVTSNRKTSRSNLCVWPPFRVTN